MKSEKVKVTTKKAKMTNKAKTPKTKGIVENWSLQDYCRLVRLASFLAVLSSLREMGFLKSETILSDEFQKDLLQKFNDKFENCVDDAWCVLFGKEEE